MERVYKHLNDIYGVYDVVKTNESQRVGKYFIIVDKNKQRAAELVIHKIMQALVHRIQDIADHDAEMKLNNQFPSLWSRLSQGGHTSEAAELDCDIFNHSTLAKSFSKPTYFDMGMNFGT